MTPHRPWRLVLLRLPPPGAAIVAELTGKPVASPLPFVVAEADGLEALVEMRDRLRAAGATVALLEAETGGCAWHATELASARCVVCGAWICNACRVQTGEATCPPCGAERAERVRNARLRRFFAVFLFTVFLYEVETWRRGEAEALTPPVHVAIIQLVPPHLEGHPAIHALNREGEWLGRSLQDVEVFYNQEYRRYVADGGDAVRVSVIPPRTTTVTPPDVFADHLPAWTRAWRAWQYPRYFHGLARAGGVDPDAFGARIYVVYTDAAGDVASDSRGSRTGRIGVSFLSVNERNLGYDVITVAHELGHVLGAADRYDPETFLGVWPEGYVQPFVEPLWPQRWGELMAVDVPVSPTGETEPRSLYMERVGYASAAEMGWITKDQAEHFYTPRLEAPDSILDAIRRARDAAQPARAPTPAECDPEEDPTSSAEE